MRIPPMKRIFFSCLLLLASSVVADDWPTYMHDNRRSGDSNETLDFARLEMAWEMESPIPQKTAWAGPAPWDAYRDDDPLDALRNFDDAPFATIVGNQVFVGSSVNDSAYAFDRATGAVEWVYPTDGPVRFPPTWYNNKVYFGSDDGYVYCLNANDGSLVWRYTPIPEADRRLIGNNGSLVPLWPVRTGVAIEDGTVYFAASLTSWKTSYICALDAENGAETYRVEGQVGDTPMGAIMVQGDNIYLPQGRISPVLLDRRTGAFLGKFGEGGLTGATVDCGAYALVTVDGDFIGNYDNRGDYGLRKWGSDTTLLATHAKANNIVADGATLYVLTDTTLTAMGSAGSTVLWSVSSDTPYSLIKAGDVLIAGGNNKVVAYDSSDGSVVWQHAVTGRAAGLAVGQGTLVVGTDEGRIAVFSPSDTLVSNEGGATDIGSTFATLNGAVSSLSVSNHHVRLCWGDEDAGDSLAGWDHVEDIGTFPSGPLSHTVEGLAANDTYYYRYAVSNSASSGWVMASSAANFITGELVLSADFTELSEELHAPATLVVERPAGTTNEALCVEFTISGSAVPGSDYVALPGKVVLAAGATRAQVQVVPIDDLEMDESLESIEVGIKPGNYMLGSPSTLSFTLVDNDALNPSEYSYQAKISFPGYDHPATLENFPALVVFEEGRGGFSYSQCAPDGGDLRFSSALRDELLSYEIESWNPAGASYVWVKVPALESADSFIRAYWGHAAKTNVQSNSEWVWNNGFSGVWHLDESSGERKDSTPEGRTGYPVGGVASSQGVLLGGAEISSGQYIDAGTGKVSAASIELPENAMTAEAWVNLDSHVGWGSFMGFLQDNGSEEYGWVLGSHWYDNYSFAVAGGGVGLTYLRSPEAETMNEWVYVAATYDGGSIDLYTNGELAASSSEQTGPIAYLDSWLVLGMYKDANEAISMDGTLDECRLSGVARSADWIWATWKTIGDPAHFASLEDLYADTDVDGMGDDWEIATFGDMITAGKTTDWDHDGFSDVDEFRAGTDAKDPSSLLVAEIKPVDAVPEDFDVTWYSRQGRIYFVQECLDLASNDWKSIASDIPGNDDLKTVRINTADQGAAFYKVRLDYDPAQ